jgi:uncharacterized glyoxalase superfamily protein PhnB
MAEGTSELPAIVPMISYEDVAAAATWLVEVFAFTETVRFTGEDGRPSHVELQLGNGVVMLGNPSPDYRGPRRHAEECEQARKWLASGYIVDGVHAYVEDVDAHFARAKAAGATILSELEDLPWGDRHYRVEDLEGHRWMFAQHIRDVSAEEWGATES